MSSKTKTVALGCIFLFFLAFSYFENAYFLSYVADIFANPPMALAMVFLHNAIAVSLIILGMSFYAEFVLTFLPKRDIEYAVLNHPRLFAAIFTIILLTVSFLRVSTLLAGTMIRDKVAMLVLISLPHGVVEAYGVYTSIHKTLKKALTRRALVKIYLFFLFAAVLEVGLTQALI